MTDSRRALEIPVLSPDHLIQTLHKLGVPYLAADDTSGFVESLTPTYLLASLTVQPEARLRSALIPLLLVHPDFASAVPSALSFLNSHQQLILQLFYMAACVLQREHHYLLTELLGEHPTIHALFGSQLGLSDTPTLVEIAKCHQELTGLSINYEGTYRQAALRLLQRLQWEREWQLRQQT